MVTLALGLGGISPLEPCRKIKNVKKVMENPVCLGKRNSMVRTKKKRNKSAIIRTNERIN